jgi:hypothetical protein
MTENPTLRTLTPSESEQLRARQRSRNRVLGVILLSMAVLFFAISIVKISEMARFHS